MRIEILQEFKGIIGETEFERENIYDVVQQKVFEMAEHCGLDVYNVLDDLRNDVLEEKEILGESLASFYWLNGRITKTQEFKEMNKVYRKTLDVELY